MAHNNLGYAFLRKGRVDEGMAQLRQAVELSPDLEAAQYDLGTALLQSGRVDEAIIHFRRALGLRPDDIRVYNNLGAAFLLQSGQVDKAIHCYQKVLELQPGSGVASRNLCQVAWLLATSPEASVRDGAKAVELAEQMDRLTGGADPVYVRTLAAAYAEAGRFAEAVATGQRALQMAITQKNAVLVDALRAQIALYQAGSPFRDTSLTNAAPHPK